jgi:hypothetical protein
MKELMNSANLQLYAPDVMPRCRPQRPEREKALHDLS